MNQKQDDNIYIIIHDAYVEQEECLMILQGKWFGNLCSPQTASRECLFVKYEV